MRAPALARLGGTQTLGSAPLLLRDAVAAWGWNPPSSVAQLAEWLEEPRHMEEAHALVPIEVGRTYMECERVDVPLGAYVRALCDESGAAAAGNHSAAAAERPSTYLAQSQVFDRAPRLAERMRVSMPSVDVRPVWWLGPGGTLSPLHRDPTHNVLVQLCGTKRIALVPADAPADAMYRAAPPQGNTSLVDVRDANAAARWPRFPHADLSSVTLSAGEALYLPKGTWHQVEAERDAPSFSIALWWG
jgi:hypothetical protein